jgi:arginine N-succinyltransferase
MFVIRQAATDDHPALIKLARMVFPGGQAVEADEMARQISVSRESFAGRISDDRARRFIFVLEDTDTGGVVGMSAVESIVSQPGEPLAYLRLAKREHYSEDLRTGQVHITLQLATDEARMSDLVALVLAPPYRGHREKLGWLLSVARFHLIGLHPEWFADTIIAELPPPPMHDRRDSLWEHLGRRFINLRLSEASRFRTQSREFIRTLFPSGEIYVSLLPPSARNQVGRVAEEAEPARALLEDLGFAFHGRIEPFAGGPILEARTSDLAVVRRTRTAIVGDPVGEHPHLGFVSVSGSGQFRGSRARYAETGDCIAIPADTAGLIRAQVGDTIGVTPIESTP